MEYRELGRTGVTVSAVTLATMLCGTATDSSGAEELLDCALDHGVNAVDTANVYGRGTSEELLGRLPGRRAGIREGLVISTKFSARMGDEDPNAAGTSRRHVIEHCQASLRRLSIDQLDIYYIHRPSTTVPIDETVRPWAGTRRGQLAAVGVELPASALRRLDGISAPGRSIVPYYLDDDLADWRPHRYRW
jgi:aryl-alcohol dehydrogenase-like predicted oxidoreductase